MLIKENSKLPICKQEASDDSHPIETDHGNPSVSQELNQHDEVLGHTGAIRRQTGQIAWLLVILCMIHVANNKKLSHTVFD